jgi:D-glycero-alpha-D-manno-heptose 1-phosphate guanylyltransferase
MILAGGRGSRLQSVVNDRPKPMAVVAGRPFLEWLLMLLRCQGVRRVTLCTGYLGEVIESYFGNGSLIDLELIYSREHTPLGTGGAIRNALRHTTSDAVLVLNGDSYCRVSVERFFRKHSAAHALASVWAVSVDESSRYGSIEVDGRNNLLAFKEKADSKQPGLINAGIYLFERSVLEGIPDGKAISMETEVLPALVGRGLHVVVGPAPFIDIGIPEAYKGAGAFLQEELMWLNKHSLQA